MKIWEGNVQEDAAEMDALVRDYYASTIAHKDMKPLAFKWDTYKALEKAGSCKLFIACDESGKLLGFALYVMFDHMHHDTRMAECTLLAVRPEHRSKGIGRALVQYAERWFKHHGVTQMVHHHRMIYKTTPLFESLGFRLEDVSYMKDL